ncbi:MAG: pilT [Frankiales bacterium]|nr:pilT [Frankiales bacterium]
MPDHVHGPHARSMATLTSDVLLEALWESKGTDLLLSSARCPMVRIDGDLQPLPGFGLLEEKAVQGVLRELLSVEQRASLEQRTEVDFAFTWRDLARLRGNAFRSQGSVRLALRLVPHEIPTFEDLGLPAVMHDFSQLHQGLVLVTGPTGSGKSTTLASTLNLINSNRACHIITIEDPIEYVYPEGRALVSQREVGTDTPSFPQALRAALREDPDVLLVGEMRDLESIQFALTLAETGHLVFATLHTNDAAQALDRIVDVFGADKQAQIRVQLASALTGIVYQRLVPRIGGGMVAAFEVLVANGAVRNLIKEGKGNQLRNMILTHASEGMQTLEGDLSRLVAEDVVSVETARLVSLFPKEVGAPPETPTPVAEPSRRARGR